MVLVIYFKSSMLIWQGDDSKLLKSTPYYTWMLHLPQLT